MDQQTIQEFSSTGRHQECLQACQQLLQGDPDSTAAWKYAGKSLLALGQLEKAQQCLTKAHQLDTKDPEITKDIGNIFLNLGSTEDATAWYKKSLEINNNYAPAINNIANIRRQNGNNQEAVNLFKQAIQADPQLVQAYVGAAASSLALGDLDQAESFAIRAIEINAHTPGINEILGITFQNKKNYQQAVESYQRELAINPKSNTSLLNLGLLLLQQGEAAAAIEPLARAAVINTSEQCSLLLAQAYQNIGKPKEAITEYKKTDIIQSQNKMIPFNLGLCLLNTGSNIDAIEAFKIAIKLDESFLPAWGNIGTALMNEGRHQEALPVTQKVLELDPNNPTAHMNLGGIYKGLGNLDLALTSTLKSLELKPDNPTAQMNLGGIYQDLGNLDQALASTLKSLELKPDNPDVLMNLGGIYKDLGNLDLALASTLKSLELKPDNPTAHMNLGGIYTDLGNLDLALASTLKSLELKPDNPTVHMNLGGIYKDLGNLDQALACTLKSLKLKPGNPNALINLGGIYTDLGNLDQALASTLKSLELKSDNSIAHMNLGGIYKDLGKLDEALASTLKALDLEPDNHTAYMNLGGIYKDLGKLDQALASTLKALDLEPDNSTAHMNLSIIHQDLGNFNQARASILVSLELTPDNHDALVNLAQIYLQDDEFEKAVFTLEKALSIKKTAKAMLALSLTYGKIGRKEESLKYALSAVRQDEKRVDSLIHLAKTYELCDQGGKAVEAAMKAIEIKDSSEDAYLETSHMLCSQKLFTNARKILLRGKRQLENSHKIDGELVRVKYLEGLLDESNDVNPWADNDDIYFDDCGGSHLIISFGSNGRVSDDEKDIPLFNFKSTLKSFVDYDKLYLRDLDRHYYVKGIRNSAPSILDLKNLLLRYVRSKKYKSVTTLGASSGGFGALLYGNLIEAEHMIAFNPQTVLDIEKETIIEDDVFTIGVSKMLRDMKRDDQFYCKCLNLKNFIPFHGIATIHCSSVSTGGIDRRYAEYLQHHRCIVKVHESSTHLLALELREKNMLASEILESINLQKI